MPKYSLTAALVVCCVWIASPGAAMAGDPVVASAAEETSTPRPVEDTEGGAANEASRKAETAVAPAGEKQVAVGPVTAAALADEKQVAVGPATVAQVDKMTCRTEVATGSRLRTRKVCSTPSSEVGSQNVLRQQQDRAAISSSIILNSGT